VPSFAAIDFETATARRDSACALGVCVVEGGLVRPPRVCLIRPPQGRVDAANYRVHGIGWPRLRTAPTFAQVWPRALAFIESAGAAFLAAHNASFDRTVLEASCDAAGLAAPTLPWVCTFKLAQDRWGKGGNKLPQVCGLLGIDCSGHHEAGRDAEMCARVLVALRGDPLSEETSDDRDPPPDALFENPPDLVVTLRPSRMAGRAIPDPAAVRPATPHSRAGLAGLAAAGEWVAVISAGGELTHRDEPTFAAALATCTGAAVAGGPWKRVEG
jgi:DNA polymerase-3 subunit epsilon